MKSRIIASVLFCFSIFSSPRQSREIFAYDYRVPSYLDRAHSNARSIFQNHYPDPPNDLTRIYYLSNQKLVALPFEVGMLKVNVFVPAPEDKVTQVRLKGGTAETLLTNDDLHFYAFVADRMEPPPHQLVRLTTTKSNRQLRISVVKGRDGYAPFDTDTIRLEHRLLERLRVSVGPNRLIFVNYMELWPQSKLTPGEYAIIGDSLADMATFRVQ
jgi:hypothetical protein